MDGNVALGSNNAGAMAVAKNKGGRRPYDVVRTHEFNHDYKKIIDSLDRLKKPNVTEEVNRFIDQLYALREKPRNKCHWKYRYLVTLDDQGEAGATAEELPSSVLFKSRDLKKNQTLIYMVETTVYDDFLKGSYVWGKIFASYKVSNKDMRVLLTSIRIDTSHDPFIEFC